MTTGNSPFSRKPLEQFAELRHEEDDQHDDDDRAHHGQEGRIGDRPHGPLLEVVLRLGELGNAGQGLFQETAFAAGPDHAHGHLAQHILEAAHGVGQRAAVFHAAVNLVEDRLQPGMRGLPFDNVDGPQERHAAAQQVGHLAKGHREHRGGHAADPRELDARAASSTRAGKPSSRPTRWPPRGGWPP